MPEFDPLMHHLEEMFSEVADYLLTKGYVPIARRPLQIRGESRDVSRAFDLFSEELIMNYCGRHKLPVVVMAEETGTTRIPDYTQSGRYADLSSQRPEYTIQATLLADPCDGSTNMQKGIIGTCVLLSVFPGNKVGAPLKPEDVVVGLTGEVNSGYVWKAEQNKGTWFKRGWRVGDYEQVYASSVKRLAEATVEIDLDFATDTTRPDVDVHEKLGLHRVIPIMLTNKYTRRNGAGTLALAYVSSGAVDAAIDVRDISTPENWMGTSLLVREAGGIITDPYGKPLEVNDMKTPGNFVASATQELHDEILKTLDMSK